MSTHPLVESRGWRCASCGSPGDICSLLVVFIEGRPVGESICRSCSQMVWDATVYHTARHRQQSASTPDTSPDESYRGWSEWWEYWCPDCSV